jgi:uncharacterized protein (DUF1684 family)
MSKPSSPSSRLRELAPTEPTRLDELELADWRRRVFELYAAVRDERSPVTAHALWRAARDKLFREHPQSPLPQHDRLRDTGLPYWPYNPSLRFALPVIRTDSASRLNVTGAPDGPARLRTVGAIELPPPIGSRVDVWWLDQYGGGLFVPLRDGSAGESTYGGGRYLLDTAKGADLGSADRGLIIDLNFLYHPSCRYDAVWQCPLAPPTNTVTVAINAGERL